MITSRKKKLQFSAKHSNQIFVTLSQPGHSSRFIGGCVRDCLINKTTFDYDIATTLKPEEVTYLLAKEHIRVIPTGIKFGTVTALIQDEKFEITTLRKEINYKGRFPEVVFTSDFELDASRRDFTINALSYCPHEEILYDYFGGMEDLLKQKIVFIGNPYDRIKEDPLRILRFFRFFCYYGSKDSIDLEGSSACMELGELLHSLSKERIIAELNKIIIHPENYSTLLLMDKLSILKKVLPINNFNVQALQNSQIYSQKLAISLETTTIYALIFYYNSELKLSDLMRLKFSKKDASSIIRFISFFQSQDKLDWNSLRYLWLDEKFLQFVIIALSVGKLYFAIAKQFILEHNAKEIPIFPLNGNDLLHIEQGAMLGKQLAYLKQLWIDSDYTLSKSELIESIKK